MLGGSETMTGALRASRPCWTIRIGGVFVLAAALGTGCSSHLHTSQPRDASSSSGADAIQSGGFTGTGGKAGTGGSGSGGAIPLPDGGACQGIPIPDFDCAHGTPSYYCTAADGGWVWTFTCPEPAQDASLARTDSGGDGGSDGAGEAQADCSAIAASIASQTGLVGTCTAVVRLDYATLRIIAHAFVCGKYQHVDEITASKTASSDGFFANSTSISGSSPEDEWVFLVPPSDLTGGAAAVSARSGALVFVGTIPRAGTGLLTIPSHWEVSDLGSGCASPASVPVRSFDLTGGQATARMREAADVVLGTALPAAFGQWGYVFDVVVLLYPGSAGTSDSVQAEYIVLLNAGWLE
jgi:hypothetical protein